MILDKFKLDGKIAFVTGLSSGPGQAMAIGLAGAVVFLCSAASDYLQGHIPVVDGGWMAR